jgi:glycosyltransferase involved in cell wall biosynthesis
VDHSNLSSRLHGDAFAVGGGRSCQEVATAVVAIPVKNEADRIAPCLLALARQTREPHGVLLLLNNCVDETEAVSQRLAASLPYELHIVRHDFQPADANAGSARAMAMHYAAGIAGSEGVLLTTDADAIVAEDWVERTMAALSAGADLVCGRVVVDPAEAALIPEHLHADDALECELTTLLDEIAFTLDPVPADPWPRHTESAGASLGVTVAAFTWAGGIPPVASGEDRAFVDMLGRMDARIRHDPSITVTVSGRIDGRAPGGMADTIRRRMQQQDEFADDKLEPAADAYRRFDFRRRVRLAWREQRIDIARAPDLAADLGIPDQFLGRMLHNRYFGAAWADVQASTPFLVRRRVRFTELARQISYARELLGQHANLTR